MHDVGINLNLAPVVDINTQVRNPVIGIRSFSEDPRTVISFARASLKGFHRANVMTTLKHFPGHGDVEIDSHEGLPILKKDLVDLEKGELRPFRELSEHTEAILTAHMMVPALDEFHCTTLSKKSLDYLRQEIGFKGLIISDSLVMEGLLKCCGTIEEAAVRAFQAGCDLILLGGKQLIGAHQNLELSTNDIEKIHQALVKAVQTGIISEDRLNVSIRRILDFKSKLQKGRSLEKIELSLHQECAEEIAKRSIQAIGSLKSLFMGPSKIWIVHPYIIEETLLKYYSGIDISTLDSVVLGCTHFVFFKEHLKKILDKKTRIIDGNKGTARHLKDILDNDGKLNKAIIGARNGEITFLNSHKDKRYIELSKILFSF